MPHLPLSRFVPWFEVCSDKASQQVAGLGDSLQDKKLAKRISLKGGSNLVGEDLFALPDEERNMLALSSAPG